MLRDDDVIPALNAFEAEGYLIHSIHLGVGGYFTVIARLCTARKTIEG